MSKEQSSKPHSIKLHNYQKKVVDFLIAKKHGAVFLDPGLGKTLCFLEAFKQLRQKQQVKTMLVVAPLRVVHSVWPQEIEKWGFNYRVSVLHGPKKLERLREPADVYVINYEGLAWLAQNIRIRMDMLVLDESSKVKSTRTQRFKILKRLLPIFRRRYIATGSPVPNGLMDLFGQMYCVDMGHSLGQYITHYRSKYFYQTGYGGYTYIPQKDAEERIYDAIAPASIRFNNKILKLPPVHEHIIEVELDKKTRRLYNEIENDLIAMWNNHEIVAANAATASMKLRQIVAGAVYTGEKTLHTHDAKLEALIELVDELEGKPVLINYEFVAELERLRSVFKNAPYIGGGVSSTKGKELVEQWNRGEIDQLFGNAQSMAYGLNMQEVDSAMIWHSQTWNLELYEQLWQRLMRQGRKTAMLMYHIIAKDTIDEEIYKARKRKDKTQQALLNAIAARAQK